jgi:hypothetical protein
MATDLDLKNAKSLQVGEFWACDIYYGFISHCTEKSLWYCKERLRECELHHIEPRNEFRGWVSDANNRPSNLVPMLREDHRLAHRYLICIRPTLYNIYSANRMSGEIAPEKYIPPEVRSRISRQVGKTLYRDGKGLFSMSPEEKRKATVSGGIAAAKVCKGNKTGLFSIEYMESRKSEELKRALLYPKVFYLTDFSSVNPDGTRNFWRLSKVSIVDSLELGGDLEIPQIKLKIFKKWGLKLKNLHKLVTGERAHDKGVTVTCTVIY